MKIEHRNNNKNNNNNKKTVEKALLGLLSTVKQGINTPERLLVYLFTIKNCNSIQLKRSQTEIQLAHGQSEQGARNGMYQIRSLAS